MDKTKVIHLKDNSQTILTSVVSQKEKKVLEELQEINLSDSQHNILIFPKSLKDIRDGSLTLPILILRTLRLKNDAEAEKIGYAEKPNTKSNKPVTVICTGNLMGFIGKGDISVSIHSRFTHVSDEKIVYNGNYNQVGNSQPIYSYNVKKKPGEDYFLYHMLQRVFNINLFNLDHTLDRQDRIMDFLLFMFPNALKNALSQGLYKEYRSQDFDDARVRGTILVNRVIQNDIPFRGRISYRTRTHSYDNTITQLVRHTIEHIKRHPFGANILNNDTDTKEYVNKIIMATPTYNPRDKEKVLKANLRPKIHPYFLKYKDLQQLCVRILRHESLKYGEDKDKVHGILFDGAWLWEEYLNTILKDMGFQHPRNKERKGAVYMFRKSGNGEDSEYPEEFDYFSQKMYPDFYLPSASGTEKAADIILDAKYKRLDRNLGREDMFQVISYMHCMKAPIGGYLYPVSLDNAEETNSKTPQTFVLNGHGGKLMTIPFQIPNSPTNWNDFKMEIDKSEDNLKKELEKLLPTYN